MSSRSRVPPLLPPGSAPLNRASSVGGVTTRANSSDFALPPSAPLTRSQRKVPPIIGTSTSPTLLTPPLQQRRRNSSTPPTRSVIPTPTTAATPSTNVEQAATPRLHSAAPPRATPMVITSSPAVSYRTVTSTVSMSDTAIVAYGSQQQQQQQTQQTQSSSEPIEFDQVEMSSDVPDAYSEVSDLVRANVEDQPQVAKFIVRVQELLHRLKTQSNVALANESKQLQQAAGRIWSFSMVHASKMQRCKDIKAATLVCACDFMLLSLSGIAGDSINSTSQQEYAMVMRMYVKTALLVIEAKVAPSSELYKDATSPSSLLFEVKPDHLLSIACEQMKAMKEKGMVPNPAIEYEIYEAHAHHAWSSHQYETAFEMYKQGYDQVLLKHRAQFREHLPSLARHLHKNGMHIQEQLETNDPEGNANQAIKWLELAISVIELDSTLPNSMQRQAKVHYTLAVVYLKKGNYVQALAEAQKTSRLDAKLIEPVLIQIKCLFHTHMFDSGHELLLKTLLQNSCKTKMALDLVEYCCEQLELSQLPRDSKDFKFRMEILREAYAKLQEKNSTDESILVSQFRTMVKHKLYDYALMHLDKIASLPGSQVQPLTWNELRQNAWPVVMEYFQAEKYQECMAWLQRYSKKGVYDRAIEHVLAHRAMATVAIELNDLENAVKMGEETRRVSSQIVAERDNEFHYPTALICRAAILMKNYDRAAIELKFLRAHVNDIGGISTRATLALIAESMTKPTTATEVDIVSQCVDLLLQLQIREPNPPNASSASRPFSNLTLLLHLIRLSKEKFDRLNKQEEPKKTSSAGSKTNLLQVEHKKREDDEKNLPMPSAAEDSRLGELEGQLATYFEQILQFAANALNDDEKLDEKEHVWLSVNSWNLGRACVGVGHWYSSYRFFSASAQFSEKLAAADTRRGCAVFARIHAVKSALENVGSMEPAEKVLLAATCLQMLNRAEEQLREPVAGAMKADLPKMDPKLMVPQIPMLQAKARLAQGDSETTMQQWIQSIKDTSALKEWNVREWATLANFTLQHRYQNLACDCLQSAIDRLGPGTPLNDSAAFWRELISLTPSQQVVHIYARLQQWLERASEVDKAAGRSLAARYPKIEAQWLVDHVWNIGTMYYRKRELSTSLVCMQASMRVYQMLTAPTVTSTQNDLPQMQAVINHVKSSLDSTMGKK